MFLMKEKMKGSKEVRNQKKSLKNSLLICGAVLTIFAVPTAYVYANDDGGYVVQEDVKIDCLPNAGSDSSSTKKDGSSDGSTASSEGDWLTEGTEAYKVAKSIYDIMTEEYGVSGAFAVGMISNVKGESAFIPDRGESAFDKPYAIRRFGMNNKKPVEGMGPSTATQNANYGYTYFGGGLFQFTPYQKFADSEYWGKENKTEGWAVENQLAFLWASEFGNKAVENYFGRVGLSDYSTVEQLISTDDPAKASQYFQMAYERPESFHSERAEWAKEANKVFNKDNKKADKSKWKFNTSTGTNSSVVDVKGKKSKGNGSLTLGDCNTADSTKVKKGGGAWGNDGTGTHNQSPSGWGIPWKPEEVPDDIKPYALDPESLGVKYKGQYGTSLTAPNSDGWIDFGFGGSDPGQCTELAATLAWHIWQKGTDHLLHTNGNGGEVVANMTSAFGKDGYSKEPKAGATFSEVNGDAGHVGIVSHVFENGDILILEQNTPYSGSGAGMPNTWNYRLIAKADVATQCNGGFYYAGDVGYTVNPDAKTLGK